MTELCSYVFFFACTPNMFVRKAAIGYRSVEFGTTLGNQGHNLHKLSLHNH